MGKTVANGITEERTYDARNRVLSIRSSGGGSTESSFEYSYDAVGNVLATEEVFLWAPVGSSSSSSSGEMGGGGIPGKGRSCRGG